MRVCTRERVCVVYKLLRYVMTNIHQLKRNCRINGANFDVQNGFTTQLRVCDWFAFDGSWLMSKYNFVYVHSRCVHTEHSLSHCTDTPVQLWFPSILPFNPPLTASFRFFLCYRFPLLYLFFTRSPTAFGGAFHYLSRYFPPHSRSLF